MRIGAATLALVASIAPAIAGAEPTHDDAAAAPADAADRGASIGIRSGYARPLGDTQRGDPLSDTYGGMVPIWIDAGYRLGPHLYVGAYVQYGIAWPAAGRALADPSAVDIRVGFNAHYHLAPHDPVDPWLGLGFGYEVAGYSFGSEKAREARSTSGLEVVNMQIGADVEALSSLRVGPFAALGVGRYSSASAVDADGATRSVDVREPAFHAWLFIGLRCHFDL